MSKAKFFKCVELARRCLDDLLTDKPALIMKKRLIGEDLENHIISSRMEDCLKHIREAGIEYGRLTGMDFHTRNMLSPLANRENFGLGGLNSGLGLVN